MRSALGEVVRKILCYDKSLEIDPLKVRGEGERKGGREGEGERGREGYTSIRVLAKSLLLSCLGGLVGRVPAQ